MSGDWPSASRVSKAGTRFRRALRDTSGISEDMLRVLAEDREVIFRHRDSHAKATSTASTSVRYHCKKLGLEDARVSQRLKRFPTIIEKLQREPTLSLDKMHDLGGVRAVVASIDDLRRLETRLLASHEDSKVADYVANPRSSGYRAVHIVTDWGRATRRRVEIQLRSTIMHQWADMVETASRAFGVNHKQDGDTPFHRWARSLSRIMAALEYGENVSLELTDEYDVAYTAFFGDATGGTA